MEDTKEDMRETIELYRIEELVEQYVMNPDAFELIIERIEKYKKEIIKLRGKAHLSCPACFDDCVGWIVDGKPCKDDWEV